MLPQMMGPLFKGMTAMTITAAQVRDLREKTGAGMMDAKSALVEAEGDMEKASEILRQRGMATADKKSGRVTAEGLVHAVILPGAQAGVLVEVNCETDFVGKGDAFKALVETLSAAAAEKAPADVDTWLTLPGPNGTLKDYLTDQIGSIKENITPRRLVHYQVGQPGLVHAYIHTGGKIGVLIELSAGSAEAASKPEAQQLAKDLTMHIASSSPEFVSRTDIPQAAIDEETRVEMGKEDIQAKPEAIRGKIVQGRVDKLMAQKVLLEQAFVKNPDQTIADLLTQQGQALGTTFSIVRFTRYMLGEGIEKKVANFAEEVMAAAQGR
jgi:elongation factor Ts